MSSTMAKMLPRGKNLCDNLAISMTIMSNDVHMLIDLIFSLFLINKSYDYCAYGPNFAMCQ